MKRRLIFAIILLILFSTISIKENIVITKFNLEKISVENNYLLKKEDITKLLIPIYNKNLLLLNYSEIEKILNQNSFIESFEVKKKYPNSIKIKIFEKNPIAILYNGKKKFYLSDKIDLIKLKKLKDYENLPSIFGNKDQFKILFESLNEINFPNKIITKYILFESNRWDLETVNKKIIKLPNKNYTKV